MEQNRKDTSDAVTIDLAHVFRVWWQKIWLILLCAVLAAVAGFSVAKFLIQPQYSASIMLYVNNSKNENSSGNITNSDILASQNLVKTYGVMLNNRSTLEKVIDKTGLSDKYNYSQLKGMISSSPANDTEVMVVTVTCGDSKDAADIANAIAEVLPERISNIIQGASMTVVDSAVENTSPISPNVPKYAILGFALGMIACLGILTLMAILDNTIHDDNYVMETYDYPILAKIPDLLEDSNSKYNYYKKSSKKTSKGVSTPASQGSAQTPEQ